MKFVHPEILWALGALAIPIIVHLFNFRKFKKVFFSNVEFLKEIKQETQSKSKLKHLLILLARLLAMACVIFAFAQPFIPEPGMATKPGGSAISIYIDNSFSMEAEGQDGRLLELAKNKAIELVNSFQASDKFQLLTSDFEGKHQRLVSKEEMTDLIQAVDISAVSRNLSEVVARQGELLRRSGLDNKKAFILTDLQASVTDLAAVNNDTTIQFNIVPDIAEEMSNLFIDSVWFESPVRQLNLPEVLHARIVNTGDNTRENIPLQLTVNGQQKSVTAATIDAENRVEVEITYTNTEPGFKNCTLKIDDDAITKDDEFFFSYNVAEKINLLEIKGESVDIEAVRTVFSDDPYFVFNTNGAGNIDFGSFATQNLIILNQLKTITSGLSAELMKFVEAGGSVLIIPAQEIVLNEYNSALAQLGFGQIVGKNPNETKVNVVNYDHYIFKEAFEKMTGNPDLPVVKSFYEIQLGSKTSAEPMMTLQTGSPFMLSSVYGSGRVYLSAVSLKTEESTFINHAFFPATLLRIAEFSQPTSQLAYTLGKPQAVLLRNLNTAGEQTFKLQKENNGNEFIPEHRNAGGNTEIFINTELTDAGNYSLKLGEQQSAVLSFNFDRKESDNRPILPETVAEQIEGKGYGNWRILNGTLDSVAADVSANHEGKKFWFSMIVWALIFLAIEVLLIKFWR